MRTQVDTIDGVDLVSLTGGVRRIGDTGPIYQVLGLGRSLLKGKPSMRIEFLESGEIIDYPLADLLEDRFEV